MPSIGDLLVGVSRAVEPIGHRPAELESSYGKSRSAGGKLMAAGLDVFRTEPLPLNSPLLKLDNVLLAPHMGGLDHESLRDMGTMAAQCVADLYQGRWPEGCVVNPEARPTWKW